MYRIQFFIQTQTQDSTRPFLLPSKTNHTLIFSEKFRDEKLTSHLNKKV